MTGQFGAVERLNPAPLGAGTLSLSQTGTTVLLQLNPGNPFNGQRNSVNIANMDVGFAIAGAGSGDSLTLEGASTVRADVSNLAQFQVGTSTGTATSVTLASGTQSVAATTVKANAQLAVNTRLASPTVTVERGGLLSGGGRITGALANAGTLSPGNSPGIPTIEDVVTNAAGSILRVEIDGPIAGTGAGFHDQLAVVGTPGTFAAGGTLAPVTRGITGGATCAFAGVAQPADGLPAGMRFDTVYGTITITATPVRYARPPAPAHRTRPSRCSATRCRAAWPLCAPTASPSPSPPSPRRRRSAGRRSACGRGRWAASPTRTATATLPAPGSAAAASRWAPTATSPTR